MLLHRPIVPSGNQRGFSIVELMVGMALSLLLLAGVIAIFVSNRSSYETTDRLSRLQENGRFALDLIVNDIRGSGFLGCTRMPKVLANSLNNGSSVEWDYLNGAVFGYNSTGASSWNPALAGSIAGLTPSPGASSDVLVVRGPARDAVPVRITANMVDPTSNVEVAPGTTTILPNDIVMAYSCEGRSFFQVRSINAGVITHTAGGAGPGNANGHAGYTYRGADTGAEIVPVQTTVYYVAASSNASLPAGSTSLYRRVNLRDPEELAEGIERMELLYGVDTNNDNIPDTYMTAANVQSPTPRWNRVFSVSVALLARSLDEYGTTADAASYQLLDVTTPAANDRRLREVFTSSISIRNQVIAQ